MRRKKISATYNFIFIISISSALILSLIVIAIPRLIVLRYSIITGFIVALILLFRRIAVLNQFSKRDIYRGFSEKFVSSLKYRIESLIIEIDTNHQEQLFTETFTLNHGDKAQENRLMNFLKEVLLPRICNHEILIEEFAKKASFQLNTALIIATISGLAFILILTLTIFHYLATFQYICILTVAIMIGWNITGKSRTYIEEFDFYNRGLENIISHYLSLEKAITSKNIGKVKKALHGLVEPI